MRSTTVTLKTTTLRVYYRPLGGGCSTYGAIKAGGRALTDADVAALARAEGLSTSALLSVLDEAVFAACEVVS